MPIPTTLHVDPRSPIPIRRQLTEQLKHAIESGAVPRDQALPSIRELASLLGINANTVARVIEDLKHGGYVEARRGRGVFVAAAPPIRPSPRLREGFLKDIVIRGAALGMTADDLAVGVLSLANVRPPAIDAASEVLLLECSAAELDFFAGQLEGHLPIRVDKVLLGELKAITRRRMPRRWRAAVTSFCHLPEVERLLTDTGVPVVALLTQAHLETLLRLAQLPTGTRVGVALDAVERVHNLEHSIANAALPNIVLVGVGPAEGAGLGRLLRRVDVVVCSSSAAERIRPLVDPSVQVIIDDRTLDPRPIEMLAALLVRSNGSAPAVPLVRRKRRSGPPSNGRTTRGSGLRSTARRIGVR
jgi:GntR family transcriptional regulator